MLAASRPAWVSSTVAVGRWQAAELGRDLPGRVLHAWPFRPAGSEPGQ